MLIARWTALTLLGVSLLSLSCPNALAARDLPFAPPRKKEEKKVPLAPILFSPFEHEAVIATLEPGWTLANTIADPKKIVLMQFLPEGDDPNNVQRMINVATYRDLRATKTNAHDFMINSQKNSEKLAPKGSLSWDVISDSNPNDVIFEYSVKGWKESPDQFEMQRAIKGQDGIHSIIYHVTSPNVSEADHAKMLAFLKSVKVRNKEEFKGLPPVSAAALEGPPVVTTVTADRPEKPAASPNIAVPAK